MAVVTFEYLIYEEEIII